MRSNIEKLIACTVARKRFAHFIKRDDPSITSERYWKHPIIGNMEPKDYCRENISALCNDNLKEINKLVEIQR